MQTKESSQFNKGFRFILEILESKFRCYEKASLKWAKLFPHVERKGSKEGSGIQPQRYGLRWKHRADTGEKKQFELIRLCHLAGRTRKIENSTPGLKASVHFTISLLLF